MDGLIALAKSVKAQQAVEDAGKFLKIGVDGKVVAQTGAPGTDADAVHYVADTGKSDAEKAQARTNIGAYAKPNGGIPDSDLAEAHYTEAEADALLAAKQDATDNNLQTTAKTVVGAINELKSSKVDKMTTVKDTTTADITVAAAANTNYIYGELTDLTITWGTGADNAEISFMFKSGSTATTLSVSTTGAKFSSYAPSANAIVEISAKWYLDTWVVIFHETAVA